MKRIVAIFLAAVMSFMLCACGSKNLTQEEREQIFYEVAEEKGALWLVDIDEQIGGLGYKDPIANLPSDDHYIEILDMELISIDNGRYEPNIKIRNILPRDAVANYPSYLDIYVSYLDSDGTAIASDSVQLTHLGYEGVTWTDAQRSFDAFDPSEVHTVSITGYSFLGSGVIDGTFSPAISFDVDELLQY